MIEFFPDEFGIGQRRLAANRLQIAEREIAATVPCVLATHDMWDDWRAMQTRRLKDALALRQRALKVMETTDAA